MAVSIALNWILFLGLFPIAFYWLRRAWRILIKRDFSEVALKYGEAPPNAARFAPYDGVLHLLAGATCVYVILAVVLTAMPYSTWTAIAGSTIWIKLMLGFALSRHAHAKAKAVSQGR